MIGTKRRRQSQQTNPQEQAVESESAPTGHHHTEADGTEHFCIHTPLDQSSDDERGGDESGHLADKEFSQLDELSPSTRRDSTPAVTAPSPSALTGQSLSPEAVTVPSETEAEPDVAPTTPTS